MKSHISRFIGGIMIFSGCMPSEKNVYYHNVDIKILLSDKLPDDNRISKNIIDFEKPFLVPTTDTAVIGYDKSIHFIRVDLDDTKNLNINIVGTEDWYNIHPFGDVGIEKKSEDIGTYFNNIQIPNDLLKSGIIKEKIKKLNKIFKYVSENKESTYLIFSDAATVNAYEGVKVFNKPDSLMKYISIITSKDNTNKFVIIYDPPISNDSITSNLNNDDITYDSLINIGNQYYNNKDCIKATIAFKQALKIKPNEKYPKEIIDKCVNENGSKVPPHHLPPPTPPTSTQGVVTLYPTYGRYIGYINKCGKFDGQGTLYYSEKHLISAFDSKNRAAEANEYVTGWWVNGYFDNGTWKDKEGKDKEKLNIGVPERVRNCDQEHVQQ